MGPMRKYFWRSTFMFWVARRVNRLNGLLWRKQWQNWRIDT